MIRSSPTAAGRPTGQDRLDRDSSSRASGPPTASAGDADNRRLRHRVLVGRQAQTLQRRQTSHFNMSSFRIGATGAMTALDLPLSGLRGLAQVLCPCALYLSVLEPRARFAQGTSASCNWTATSTA